MKIVIVNAHDEVLGEVKLSQQLLNRSEFLVDSISDIIRSSVRSKSEQPSISQCRIVENSDDDLFESLNDDDDVFGVPLNETCDFDFEKHVAAIDKQHNEIAVERLKYTVEQPSKRYDARYKEHLLNKIRYK